MPKTFEELMNEFRNPGENGIPETFVTDLQETYEHDLSIRDAAVNDREAQITEKETALSTAQAEINRLKAVNYDLIQSAPKAGNPANDNTEPDDVVQGVDSLFE